MREFVNDIPILPSIQESEQFKRAIRQGQLPAEIGYPDLQYPFEKIIEALFQYYEGHAESHEKVLDEAQRRNDHRQQVANFRRARSMMQQFDDQRE